MPSSKKMKSSFSNPNKFYAVKIGRKTGIYNSWAECEAQVKGFPGAKFQKLATESEARQFAGMSNNGSNLSSNSSSQSNSYSSGSNNSHFNHTSSYSNGGTYYPSSASSSYPTPFTSDSSSTSSSSKSISNSTLKPGEPINVYCDGASAGNGREGSKAGYGIYFTHPSLQHLNQSCRLKGKLQTNNRAELTGILETLTSIPPSLRGTNPLVIHTDSKYSINSIQDWSKNWKKNGWKNSKGLDVMNKDLIRKIGLEIEKRNFGNASGSGSGNERKDRLDFVHVKGHSGDFGNEMADKLATSGAQLGEVMDDEDEDELPNSDTEEYRNLVKSK